MKIALATQFWPNMGNSGVAIAARAHYDALTQVGHDVAIIGPDNESMPGHEKMLLQFPIDAKGSGSIYSPIRADRKRLQAHLQAIQPDLVIMEGWQNAIAQVTLELATAMNLPTLMISHGISIHAFSNSLKDVLRSMAWQHYRYFCLPASIKKLTAITCLNQDSQSPRFFDRDLAIHYGIPIFPLGNAPANYERSRAIISREGRDHHLLIVGYFSRIKNQLAALELLRHLPKRFHLTLIGPKAGTYYQKCQKFVSAHQLSSRAQFLEDHECSISQKISECLVLLSTSLTEVLPIVLLEAMASGTPFVATPVGAVPELRGGILCKTLEDQIEAVLAFESNQELWRLHAKNGFEFFKQHFSPDKINAHLLSAVEKTVYLARSSK